MRELALHLLDIAQNSVAAGASAVTIAVHQDTRQDRLRLTVSDDGRGMDTGQVARAGDPFATTRTERRVGLGIGLLKAAAEECEGWLKVESVVGHGTRLTAEFQDSHIDRMPLGDLAGTWLTLLVGHSQVHWTFQYRKDDAEFCFDDRDIKRELGDLALTEPPVLGYLRSLLSSGVAKVSDSIQAGSAPIAVGGTQCHS